MVPYNKDKTPGLSQWTSGDMNASITLDRPGSFNYTNLDQITGTVVLRCSKSANIDAIVVKLEGESRTRLLSPVGPNGEKPKPQLEHHKACSSPYVLFSCSPMGCSRLCVGCILISQAIANNSIRESERMANYSSYSTKCKWCSHRPKF